MTLIFGFKIKPNIPRQTGTLENTSISDANRFGESKCWELPKIVQTLHECKRKWENETRTMKNCREKKTPTKLKHSKLSGIGDEDTDAMEECQSQQSNRTFGVCVYLHVS